MEQNSKAREAVLKQRGEEMKVNSKGGVQAPELPERREIISNLQK